MNEPIATKNHPIATKNHPIAESVSVAPGIESGDIGLAERKLRADAARNRQRVLTAAAEVFAKRGLDVSLDEVAHAAGVGVGTVYRRFPNKETLVDALFEDKIENMVGLAREAMEFEDPWEGFVHFIEHALEWQMRNRGLRDVLLRSEFGCAAAARARDIVTPILSAIIERAQGTGEAAPRCGRQRHPNAGHHARGGVRLRGFE